MKEQRLTTTGHAGRKAAPRIERKAGGGNRIVGYAAVFYDANNRAGTTYTLPDGMEERILPGAFDRALRERQDVLGLFNHDPNHLLGRTEAGTLRLTVDGVGLRYEIDAADTSTARDVLANLRAGNLFGSSFSFSIPRGGQRFTTDAGREVREITDANLYDVGPVASPAYRGTLAAARVDEPKRPDANATAKRLRAIELDQHAERERNARAKRLRARAVEVSTAI